MKGFIRIALRTVAFASLLTLFAAPKHGLPKVMAHDSDDVYTLATLTGPFAELLKGTIIGLGPVAAVGVRPMTERGMWYPTRPIA